MSSFIIYESGLAVDLPGSTNEHEKWDCVSNLINTAIQAATIILFPCFNLLLAATITD